MNYRHLQLSPNFKLGEFRCRGIEESKACCCHGAMLADELLVSVLQELRDAVGSAVRLTSAFRCEEYNKAVNRHTRSFHRVGKAADVTNPWIRDNLFLVAKDLGKIVDIRKVLGNWV